MHDLNGQVFIVRGMAEMLRAEVSGNPAALARVEKILAASEKIAAIAAAVGTRAREKNL